MSSSLSSSKTACDCRPSLLSHLLYDDNKHGILALENLGSVQSLSALRSCRLTSSRCRVFYACCTGVWYGDELENGFVRMVMNGGAGDSDYPFDSGRKKKKKELLGCQRQ